MSIYTYSGKTLDLINVSPNDICAEDIAHALSRLCRASGQFKHFYSVAQHSLNCMKEAYARGFSRRVCFAALLHDASEAYIADLPRPVKELLPDYMEIEKRVQDAVYKKFGLWPLSDEEKWLVRLVDDACLWYEFKMIHTMPLQFEKIPNLATRPDVGKRDIESIEQMFLREINAFTKLKLTA